MGTGWRLQRHTPVGTKSEYPPPPRISKVGPFIILCNDAPFVVFHCMNTQIYSFICKLFKKKSNAKLPATTGYCVRPHIDITRALWRNDREWYNRREMKGLPKQRWALMMMHRVLPQWLVNTWPQKSYQTFHIKGFENVVSILNNLNWAKI